MEEKSREFRDKESQVKEYLIQKESDKRIKKGGKCV